MANSRQRVSEMRRTPQGFSLIELLVTIAIILIIVAIAIPNYLRSKIAANEADAVQNLRTTATAAALYNQFWQNGYPPDLTVLGGTAGNPATCDQANVLDPLLTTAPYSKSGYVLGYTGEEGTVPVGAGCGSPGFVGYLITAVPQSVGVTGNRSFCTDEQGSIHYDLTGQTASSQSACEALTAVQ
jgi:type IV pilus assembly protein PilA